MENFENPVVYWVLMGGAVFEMGDGKGEIGEWEGPPDTGVLLFCMQRCGSTEERGRLPSLPEVVCI